MKYDKPFLTFEEQVDKLVSRGMTVDDPKRAADVLANIGYYRLSAYWYHWRQGPDAGELADHYGQNARFEDSVLLYDFDRELRLVLLDAIERVEVSLRVAMANVAGRRDPFIHMSTDLLGEYARRVDPHTGMAPFATFIRRCHEAYDRSSEDFVKHCKVKYEDGPAIWVHIETWDFGLLSNFYKLLDSEDQQEVATKFGIQHYTMFESWIASLNYVRNLCAHHSRCFRRTLVVRPGTKLMMHIPELDHVRSLNRERIGKIYPVLAILHHLIQSCAPESAWRSRLCKVVHHYPVLPTTSLADYGFPDDWQMQEIWKRP